MVSCTLPGTQIRRSNTRKLVLTSIDDLGKDKYVGKSVASAFAFEMALPFGKLLAKEAAAALAKAVIATGALAAGTAVLAATI